MENNKEQIKSNDTNKVLRNRAKIYGKYSNGVQTRAVILAALNTKYKETHKKDLPEDLRIMFGDIALKLMRCASDPSVADSWVDLAGYAKLVKEVMVDGK